MTEHIKIGNVTPRIRYEANGTQSSFTYPFPIFKEDDLNVWVNDELQEDGYTITGAGSSDGGEVVFNSAPSDGFIITLIRKIVIERTSDFQTGGSFRAKVINDELDLQTASIQQVNDEVSRSLRLSPYADEIGLEIPIPNAGKALLWNETADGFVNSDDNFNDIFVNTTAQADIATSKADEARSYRDAALTAQTSSETAQSEAEAAQEAAETARDSVLNDAGFQTVVADLEGDNNIGTIADSIANVNIVASDMTNINTVANNTANISNVAANEVNINAVSDISGDIEVCSNNIDDISNAAGFVEGFGLPTTPVANSFLQRNSGNTAYESKTISEVKTALGIGTAASYDVGTASDEIPTNSTVNVGLAEKLDNPMIAYGDIIYAGTGGTPQRLPRNTPEYLLSMNSSGTAPMWKPMANQAQAEAGTNNTLWMTPLRVAQAVNALASTISSYNSGEQPITAGGSLSLTHGLGGVPKWIRAYLVCKTAENGYAVGDRLEIPIGPFNTDVLKGVAIVSNSNTIDVRYRNVGGVFGGINFTNGNTVLALTNANWRFVVEAYNY